MCVAATTWLLVMGALLAGVCLPASAQEVQVPVGVQFPMLLKAVTFNKALAVRTPGRFTVAVVYQKNFRPSSDMLDEILKSASEGQEACRVGELPGYILPIDISGGTDLRQALREGQADFVFVTPLRDPDLRRIILVGTEDRILTAAAVPAYVHAGVGIGVERVAGRPRFLINLTAVKNSGAKFSSRLLKLATVLQ